MHPGRLLARINARLIKNINDKGKIDFTGLQGLEIQRKRPLSKFYTCQYLVSRQKNELCMTITADQDQINLKPEPYITGFFFELVIVYGDPSDIKKLRVDSEMSDVYPITAHRDNKPVKKCRLSLQLPSKNLPWMMLLKFSLFEHGEAPAQNKNFHAMAVVRTGNGPGDFEDKRFRPY